MTDLKLAQQDINDFAKTNGVALQFNWIATQDYIASRCCMFNGLLSQGFVLAAQSIEKLSKATLLLLNPSEDVKKKYKDHNIEPIIQKIQTYQDLGLNKFQNHCVRLSKLYHLCRYPDNANKENSWGMGSDEIEYIDEIFFHMYRVAPIPDEIKYRSGIYVYLCDKTMDIMPGNKWLSFNNKQFAKEKEKIENRYNEVYEYRYNSKRF